MGGRASLSPWGWRVPSAAVGPGHPPACLTASRKAEAASGGEPWLYPRSGQTDTRLCLSKGQKYGAWSALNTACCLGHQRSLRMTGFSFKKHLPLQGASRMEAGPEPTGCPLPPGSPCGPRGQLMATASWSQPGTSSSKLPASSGWFPVRGDTHGDHGLRGGREHPLQPLTTAAPWV